MDDKINDKKNINKKLFKDFPKNKIDGINFKKISTFGRKKKKISRMSKNKRFHFSKENFKFQNKNDEKKVFQKTPKN